MQLWGLLGKYCRVIGRKFASMEEYYLLYYEWKCVELPEDPLPGLDSRPTDIMEDLIYCVSIGDLDAATAEAIATKHRINYYNQSWGTGCRFRGFAPGECEDEEPEEGFYSSFYEIWSRQSLTESLAAACDTAMRRFEEDKDNPLGDGFRNFYQSVRQDADGASNVISQPVISTDEPLVVSTPFPIVAPEQDELQKYFYARLAGGPRDPFEDFDIVLDPKRALASVEIFINRLFWVQNTFTLWFYNEEYMLWEGNAYRKIEIGEIEKRILLFLEMARVINKDGGYEDFLATPARITEIEKLLRSKRFTQLGKNAPCWMGNADEKPATVTDASLLIFDKTKILHIADPESCQAKMEILPPSPHWFNLAALDYEFDPNATCPQWDRFLNDIFGNDAESKATIMEFVGLSLTTITKFQKALFIKGPKRSGKGTIARIIQAVIGEHNVAAQSMDDFAQKFGLETFVGKTLVAVSDARVKKNISAGTVERILCIIGEDPMKIDQKYKKALDKVRLATKLLFLSNMLLKIPDQSGVLPSRFIYVKLTESFYGREDEDLEKKLLAELPGILNSAIRHLRALLARKKFIQPKTDTVLYDQMMGLCSPVYEFAQELEPCMPPDTIWKKWNEFCKGEGEKTGKQKDLWEQLDAAGYIRDFDAANIMARIRKLGGEASAHKLRDCAEKFKKSSEVLDQKLQEMVKLGRLDVHTKTTGNNQPTKFYSIKTDRPV